ncbi:hypothetical protein FQN60_017887 [Etheostoma spectabile]|uniref:Uncharacterized protein n=1 Tax=Etheostoma spectabile TaxID=54343 RepID=A0A5J5DGH9_9PERO|nr:hypothetical protein FQN60_017887 [Etheostoma spectabile]
MSKENKPLEVGILRRVKEVLAEVDPRTAAKQITKADCTVARILSDPGGAKDDGSQFWDGAAYVPHGTQVRQDTGEVPDHGDHAGCGCVGLHRDDGGAAACFIKSSKSQLSSRALWATCSDLLPS